MTATALIKAAKAYLPSLNEKRLKHAYEFAARCHDGQKRMDGSPYIIHPLAAAMRLTKLKVDEDTLVACLLHDVPEDTECTVRQIEKTFGKKVAFLVEGVTKLSKVKYRNNMAERQVESLKKFFLHSAKDLRIILIKLADRLHNMQTLGFVREEKQRRIAKETMEIYAPIANLLGIWGLKSELEDLCFKHLYPKEYVHICKEMQRDKAEQSKILKDTIRRIKRSLKAHDITAEVESRPKNLYSIFTKMVRTNRRLQDLNDLLGLRIIVDDRVTCYRVLGIVHELFPPKSGRFKDYIAVPKGNDYQSLHTTVFGIDGTPTEFQIRTHEMHMQAEYGIAAHYFYKNSGRKFKKTMRKHSEWMQRILELQKDLKNNYDFLEKLKVDVFQDRIFVFTPQGDVIDLPHGANGIDFAYHIHSDVGDHAVNMYRNGKEFPITTTLKSGDTVEVALSSKQKYPRREWLARVKTNLARNKIRLSLKNQTPEQWYKSGQAFLKRELRRYGGEDFVKLNAEQKAKLVNHFELSSWKSFLQQLGNGSITEEEVLHNLYTPEEILGTVYENQRSYKTPIAKVPYREAGSRLVDDIQSQGGLPFYRIGINVETEDRVGLLRDLAVQLANEKVNIYQIGVRSDPRPGIVDTQLIIEVIDLKQLKRAFEAIESVDGVLSVYRITNTKKAIPQIRPT